ncbi:MAG: hypothetical protein EOM28_10510 [Clostridia bacterium]|nr:hypothetical protein [Clostridia bacterium]
MMKEQASEFIRRLSELGKGDQVALKRALGETLNGSSGKAQAAFFKVYLGGNEGSTFLAATVICFLGIEEETAKGNGSVGEALHRYKVKEAKVKEAMEDSTGLDNKLAAILDVQIGVQEEFFASKISRIIRMLKQKDCIPEYGQLVVDLTNWDKETRYVQRSWAKDYYSKREEERE